MLLFRKKSKVDKNACNIAWYFSKHGETLFLISLFLRLSHRSLGYMLNQIFFKVGWSEKNIKSEVTLIREQDVNKRGFQTFCTLWSSTLWFSGDTDYHSDLMQLRYNFINL